MYLKWLFLIDFLETIIRENRLTIEAIRRNKLLIGYWIVGSIQVFSPTLVFSHLTLYTCIHFRYMYSHSSFCNVRFTNTINRIDKVIVSSSPFHLLQTAYGQTNSH